jgi:hypothetical protein
MKNESVQRESIHIAPTLPLVLRKVGGYSKTLQQEEKERFRGVSGSGSSFSLGTFQGFHFWPLHEPSTKSTRYPLRHILLILPCPCFLPNRTHRPRKHKHKNKYQLVETRKKQLRQT